MLYNKYGIRVYTLPELSKMLNSVIIQKQKERKNLKQGTVAYNFKNDYLSGYIDALEWVREEASREHWQLDKHIEYEDTLKGRLNSYLDENVIPELDNDGLDVIMLFKEFLNGNFEY